MVLRSPPDEDLLELMVRIAETPEEWERIHTVLKELGIEKRRSQEQPTHQNSTTANNSLLPITANSSSFHSPPLPPPSSTLPPPRLPFTSSSRLEENKANNNRSTLPDRIEEFVAKNNSTRKARVRSVVGTKFRKKKKGARRKEKEEFGGEVGKVGGGGEGRRRRQHHRRRNNGVWPKLHRAKKNSRRIEARSTRDEEGERWREDEQQEDEEKKVRQNEEASEKEDVGETYNWMQLIRLRHDKVDEVNRRSSADMLADRNEVEKEDDYREEVEEEEEEEELEEKVELEDNHVSWVPSMESSSVMRGATYKTHTVPESHHYQIEDNNLPADPSWHQTADTRWKQQSAEDNWRNQQSADSSSSQTWSEKDKVRPTFAYHRVTANPRERQRAATAYVAVSVVKNNATVLDHSHQDHKAAATVAAPAPWSHARHLHRIQEQLKSLSMSNAKLRHHWYEKEELQPQISDEDNQQNDPTS
ncbi:trichohyalin [Nilaparvata lugens]|uniref:trichohyalin n=1 Tax=Nilaparvata lugens TaxID=108931 RepID=UPI00193D3198|nr:trichohyalin [Nilaparvata lugens]